MVVDLVPAACHHVRLTMAPVKPLTQAKKVTSKGKAVPCPTTRLHTCKVMQIESPMPEVADIEVPSPTISGPSWVSHTPLFKELVGSGDDNVGKEVPVPSGK